MGQTLTVMGQMTIGMLFSESFFNIKIKQSLRKWDTTFVQP